MATAPERDAGTITDHSRRARATGKTPIVPEPRDGPRRLIVVGASAGGLQALTRLVAGLPGDLSAAVCVVVHFPASGRSVLPQILARAGPLPATHARSGEPLESGHIYVAPPDHHLTVQDGHLRLTKEPRVNRNRPAIDPLFWSAARAHGAQVIGVILSGNLDDGTAGLLAIRREGGIAVIQDPVDAAHPDMPQAALETAGADHVAPSASLGHVLAGLVQAGVDTPGDPEAQRRTGEEELIGHFSCPDCGGVLTAVSDGELIRYRCRVGHEFSPETLFSAQTEEVEAALWVALRALDEKAEIAGRLAARFQEQRRYLAASSYEGRAREARARAATLRGLIVRSGVGDEHPRDAAAGDAIEAAATPDDPGR